ncbi:MAG: 30S ribosome-binding factor RbfA [Candidatus Wildermuthbacteria bacterium]|nr:30S ribosome-binding factor RbfA [Candidatus Wildermuthbacteria bacterium]
MPKRLLRLNSLLKREISQIILREFDFPLDVLVTITRVETSSNLIDSSVWVSVLPDGKKDEIMSLLEKGVYSIQQNLNDKLRMRPVPKLRFLEEKLTVEAGKVEGLLERLKK